MVYTLFCIVLGQKSTFSVEVDETQTVGELKRAIKNTKPIDFKDVDADHLTLHQIKIVISDNDDEYDNVMNGISQPDYVFDPKHTLIPTSKISKYFEQGPEGDIHILVELPKGKSIHCGGVVLMADVAVQMQPTTSENDRSNRKWSFRWVSVPHSSFVPKNGEQITLQSTR